MSTAYEAHGRVAQKQRTRNALVTAALDLLAKGETPTVEATADAASISRTTAYRYFPNQHALLAAAYPEIEAASFLPASPPSDPEERLAIVVDEFLRLVRKSELQQRATLRLSLELASRDASELPLRQGRAIRWYTDALEPVRAQLGEAGLRRLVLGIRATTGIESFVWLVDVAGLSRRQAIEQMRWNAMALYRSAIAES
jgi:AcrR family transcriptional regulator